MYQTLYRKYRPQTFSDVCGQEPITAVLKQQSANGTLTHAYLFCGTRGTGKTSCAKILAKAVNCQNPQEGEPCNECDTCKAINSGELLDVLEIDAASNNGVDNIRKLCEDISFLPALGKKRVYIIDEVHMLSAGAFNALLKTLEEPPAHVLFVLATTELPKVPATIRSRCQCFTFSRISVETIARRVQQIAAKEGIPLEEGGALLIARLADGAMRDALSLLELCVGKTEPLTEEVLEKIFGAGNGEQIANLAVAALEANSALCIELLGQLYASMGDMKLVLSEVLSCLFDALLLKTGAALGEANSRSAAQKKALKEAALPVSEQTILYDISVLEQTLMRFDRLAVGKKMLSEIAFLRICNPSIDIGNEALEARLSRLEAQLQNGMVPKASSEQKVSKAQTPPPPRATQERPNEKVKDKPVAQIKSEGSVFPDEACEYADKLMNELCRDRMLKPYFKGVLLSEEKNTLFVSAPAFTLRVLQGMEGKILSAAKQIAPHIERVLFRSENTPSKQAAPDDLEGF